MTSFVPCTSFDKSQIHISSIDEDESSNTIHRRYQEILKPTIFMRALSDNYNQYNEIQISGHIIKSKSFLQEVSYLFPSLPASMFCTDSLNPLIVIHTMQHAVEELVKVGEHIEVEKDRLLINVSI